MSGLRLVTNETEVGHEGRDERRSAALPEPVVALFVAGGVAQVGGDVLDVERRGLGYVFTLDLAGVVHRVQVDPLPAGYDRRLA